VVFFCPYLSPKNQCMVGWTKKWQKKIHSNTFDCVFTLYHNVTLYGVTKVTNLVFIFHWIFIASRDCLIKHVCKNTYKLVHTVGFLYHTYLTCIFQPLCIDVNFRLKLALMYAFVLGSYIKWALSCIIWAFKCQINLWMHSQHVMVFCHLSPCKLIFTCF
jgi:hypothetical protein